MAWGNNFIDELKAKINIVDVIGREVSLKKAGSNYKGLCPFHNEKTPSFMVNEQKQIFNCFGCGEKGDVIQFVRRYHNLEFTEAVDKLCEDFNIPKPKGGRAPKVDYETYYEINRKAARFFFRNLTGAPNPGYAYIRNRGIKDETIKHFGLGYAPDRWNALRDHLTKAGAEEKDLEKLGLVNKGREGYYDKFRGRVIFPIFNTRGKVIGFGGRALGDVMPKYLNSSESEVFLKKNNLYGLNFTKNAIADEDCALLVEGYMDAISLYQSGVRNVVASLGTALTENQAQLLTRYTKNVVLSYDSDSAGIKAALRGIEVLNAVGAKVRILQIKDGKDPDEFVRKHGKEAFLRLVGDAVPATEFRLALLRGDADLSEDLAVLEYVRRCVPVLRSVSPVEQDIYIRKLATEFGLSTHAIEAEVATGGSGAKRERAPARTLRRERRNRESEGDVRLELSLLLLGLRDTRYLERFREDGLVFRTDPGVKILAAAETLAEKNASDLREIKKETLYALLDPEEENLLRRLAESVRIGPDEEEYYADCRARCLQLRREEQRIELMNDLAVAEKLGNEEEVAQLAQRLMELDQQIRKGR